MAKRVGVILSGCGVYDGAELHEAVCTLLALDRAGLEVICMAPNVPQMHVINHLAGEPMAEERNVLTEAARVARGKIRDITTVSAQELDALVLPGGFGAAKNLCDFAVRGPDCDINADVERLIRDIHAAKKPIGAMCIAPAVVARAFKGTGVAVTVTIGNDPGTVAAIEAMGAKHEVCPPGGRTLDTKNRLVTTPAYMYDSSLTRVAQGIDAVVKDLLEML